MPGPDATGVLTAQSRLVVVDVVVRDRSGKPVRNLSRDSFRLTEDGSPEVVRSFEEVDASPVRPSSSSAPPRLAPGVFTNAQPVPASGTLNVLLLDALNTPMSDQAYLLDQLKRYLVTARAENQTAIFGLNTDLVLLQGFTTDPAVLRAVVEGKRLPTHSTLLRDPTGANTDQTTLTDEMTRLAHTMGNPGMVASMIAAVQRFEERSRTVQLQSRIQTTLDAFEVLGRYLAAFPGRKNLVWFSGSFPLEILPSPDHASSYALTQTNEAQFHEVVDLLTRAQVAVYPVDAGGVRSARVFAAGTSGPGFRGNNPKPIAQELSDFENTETNDQGTMKALARDTGGEAFYNTNDLAAATAAALGAGSHFYALSYTPGDTNWNRAFRSIHVELAPEAAQRGYSLAYRRGYYAISPGGSARAGADPGEGTSGRFSYRAASMSLGAPAPADLLFKVQIQPATAQPERVLAPDNVPGPAPAAAPFQRFAIDFVTAPQQFTLPEDEKGIRSGRLECLAYVLGPAGQLRSHVSREFALQLPPQTYVALRQGGMRVHMEVSAPAEGDGFLRLGLRDETSGKMGVVEVPLSAVRHLPPLAATGASGTPSNPLHP